MNVSNFRICWIWLKILKSRTSQIPFCFLLSGDDTTSHLGHMYVAMFIITIYSHILTRYLVMIGQFWYFCIYLSILDMFLNFLHRFLLIVAIVYAWFVSISVSISFFNDMHTKYSFWRVSISLSTFDKWFWKIIW